MAYTIKPIETSYRGYRFRSRIEARYAVFFDTLGLDWEYELEGYELDGGVRYLPDFYLPSLRSHVEVKPTHDHVDFDLLKMFSVRVKANIIPCYGNPHGKRYWPIHYLPKRVLETEWYGRDGRVYRGEHVCIDDTFMNVAYIDDFEWAEPNLLRAAVKAARSARFEFGECGF